MFPVLRLRKIIFPALSDATVFDVPAIVAFTPCNDPLVAVSLITILRSYWAQQE